jgi:hypothetical protein
VLAIFAAIITYQIFIPPLIGIADSGDFERIIPYRGLAHVSDEFGDKYFSHFNSNYRIITKFGAPDYYYTSTSLFINLARGLSITAGSDRLFDIRILSAIYAPMLILGVWFILIATRPFGIAIRTILSSMLVIIFADAGYIAYFNSFYSEGTALATLMIAIGSGLILIYRRSSSPSLLAGYFLASAIAITSKPMYVILVPALAAFGVYLSKYLRLSWRYWLSGGLAVALCCLAAWYYSLSPQILKIHSAYVAIFMDLLPNSSTPQQDLADLGLNPNYALFTGTTPYQSDSPLNNPDVEADLANIGPLSLPIFYLTHPERLYNLLSRCARHILSTRVRRLGYYEAYTGMPPKSQAFGVWSIVRENLFANNLPFLCAFFLSGAAAIVFLRRDSSVERRPLYLLYLLFIYIAGTQFLVSVMVGGGEADLEKHLFMFNLAFDACFILAAMGAVTLLRGFRARLSVASRRLSP